MTIAPSTASGRSWNSGMRNSIVTIRKQKRTMLESCDLTPDESATAERERLASTANPCSRPAPEVGDAEGDELLVGVHLVAVLGGELARAPATDSAKAISASANASGSRSVMSPSLKLGTVRRRQAVGDGADDRDAVVLEVEDGDRRRSRARRRPAWPAPWARTLRSAKMSASAATPMASVEQAGVAELPRSARPSLPKKPVPPPSTPNSLESCPTPMTRARPATKPVSTGRAKKSAMNPARARPATSSSDADEQGEQRREGDEAAAVAERQRRDGGRRVRRDRRARADRELPAGAEDGVGEQRRQGGEQAGLRRHAGERGVGHALRHEHRPDGRRRDEVRPQPAPLVLRQPVADGQRRRLEPVPAHDPSRHAHVLLVGPTGGGGAPGGILRRAVARHLLFPTLRASGREELAKDVERWLGLVRPQRAERRRGRRPRRLSMFAPAISRLSGAAL